MAKEKTEEQKTVEAIADNISKLCEAVIDLLNGPLNKKALIVLLANSTKMPQYQIENVLKALEDLKKDYLKK